MVQPTPTKFGKTKDTGLLAYRLDGASGTFKLPVKSVELPPSLNS
jgi:hypothetical protein